MRGGGGDDNGGTKGKTSENYDDRDEILLRSVETLRFDAEKGKLVGFHEKTRKISS